MPTSKLIWSCPQINQNRKIKNAILINETSVQSLKFQILLFFLIIFEIYVNLFQRIINIEKCHLDIYKIICKTLLSVNLIFLICYAYQILKSRYDIYIINNENKLQSILKIFLFDLVPVLKSLHEKIIGSKIYLKIFSKSKGEEEKERIKLMEERRKILTKSYFPSMTGQFGNYVDHYIHQNNDPFCSPDPKFDRGNNSMGDVNNLSIFHSLEQESPKPMQSSTPFNNLKVGSITFGGDITPIQSPVLPSTKVLPQSSNVKYKPSTPSPTRIGSRYSPGTSLYVRGQAGVLTEIPLNEIWKRFNIDSKLLDDWTFSLRQWIHGTIISRVVSEIDNLNRRFQELGITDVVIGDSNVQTLRHLTNQPMNPFPTLSALINFLDCSKDQAYVVNRLKELNQGCSLGKFQWDCGSSSVRHGWKEHLPNDTMLILHMLCTYIEVRNSVNSNLHGVRTFSQQFITDNVLSKDINELKDAFLLYQTSVQPPHFKVVFNQAIYEMPPGRKNLFYCLLVFFHKIYKNEGNFKWLNLGRSGMNINNIFDK